MKKFISFMLMIILSSGLFVLMPNNDFIVSAANPAPDNLNDMIIGKWNWNTIDDSGGGMEVREGYYIIWEGGGGTIEYYSDGTYFATHDSGLSVTGTYRIENSTIISTQSGIIPVTFREVVTIIDNDSFVGDNDLASSSYYYERAEPTTQPTTQVSTEVPTEPPTQAPTQSPTQAPTEPPIQTTAERPTVPQTGTQTNITLFSPIPLLFAISLAMGILGVVFIRRRKA